MLRAGLLGLGLLEAGLRTYQYLKFGANFTYYKKTLDEASGLEVPVAGDRAGPISINSLGFRGPEIEVPKPPGRIRLAFLGGSTTFCAEASDDEHVWPHLVTEALRARHPGVEFDYVNGAAAGFASFHSRKNLEFRVAPLQPDVIVVYHATNDLTHDSRKLAVAAGLHEEGERHMSRISDWWLTWYMIEKNLKYHFRRKAEGEHGHFLEATPQELAADFDTSMNALLAEAKAVAPVVAVATFSHRARREMSPEEQRAACVSSLYYMPYMSVEGLMSAFEEMNRGIRAAAERNGAILIGGEHTIPGDAEHFYDSVHLTDAGCRLMAERVVAGLEAAPAFQELVAAH